MKIILEFGAMHFHFTSSMCVSKDRKICYVMPFGSLERNSKRERHGRWWTAESGDEGEVKFIEAHTVH